MRKAEQLGYRMERGTARDRDGREYDGYRLTKADGGQVVVGAEPHPFSATLDDVECLFYYQGTDVGRAITQILGDGYHIFGPDTFRAPRPTTH